MSDSNSVAVQIRGLLRPQLLDLTRTLTDRGEHLSFAFFMELLQMLDAATTEEDLIGCMVQLSTCAFVGLDYGPESSGDIDDFLQLAEQLSATMATHQPH